MMAIAYADENNFDELVTGDFTIVDFFSVTCAPCRMLSQFLEDLEGELPFVNIVKVNTTQYPKLGERFHIMAVPTLHFYQNGMLKECHVGVMAPPQLKAKITEYLYG